VLDGWRVTDAGGALIDGISHVESADEAVHLALAAP
jgi:hypothetical protein